MKTSILAAAIIAALSVPIASAQDKSAPAKPAMNMDMGKAAPEPSSPATPATKADTDKQSANIRANMDRMRQQMDTIATTTDPKERKKLMETHMQTMQENMKMMRDMGSPKMKDGGERGAMAMGNKKGSMPNSDMQKRHDMMDTRMDMMQEMMEQMMQRDKAMKPMGHM